MASKPKQTWGPNHPKLSWSLIENVRADTNKLRGRTGKAPKKDIIARYHISGSTFWWITRGWTSVELPRALIDPKLVSHATLEDMRNTLMSMAEQDEYEAEETREFDPIERVRVFHALADMLERAMTKRQVQNGETK